MKLALRLRGRLGAVGALVAVAAVLVALSVPSSPSAAGIQWNLKVRVTLKNPAGANPPRTTARVKPGASVIVTATTAAKIPTGYELQLWLRKVAPPSQAGAARLWTSCHSAPCSTTVFARAALTVDFYAQIVRLSGAGGLVVRSSNVSIVWLGSLAVVHPFAGDWATMANGVSGTLTLDFQTQDKGKASTEHYSNGAANCAESAIYYAGNYAVGDESGEMAGCTNGSGTELVAWYESTSGTRGTITITIGSGDTSFSGTFRNISAGNGGPYTGTLTDNPAGSGRT